MIEVELRAKINDTIINNIRSRKDIVNKDIEKKQEDLYLKHIQDKERNLVIRFRNVPGKKTKLTFKGKCSGTSDDIAWPEYEIEIDNEEILKQLLLNSGYEKLVLIQKTRHSYILGDIEINIDYINGLGVFVEAEIMTDDDIEVARRRIESLFDSLGIAKDNIVTEGYVPLCIKANITNI